MHELAQGRDPAETKKTQRAKTAAAATNTLRAVAEQYFKLEHGKLRTAAEREATLRRLVFPTLGDRQIDAIKRSEIVRLLDKIETSCGARTADLALAYVRRIFRWYEGRDDDFKSPVVSAMRRYDSAAHERERVLNDDELKIVWKASAADGPFPAFIRFLLLTASRRNEAAHLRWDELGNDGWLLPASRHKDKRRDLFRPLSKAAWELINAQPRIRDCPFVFTHDGTHAIGFGRAKVGFTKKCGIANWTLHDLRRTSRTLLSRAGIPADICERCLGHTIGGVRGVYDRYEYRDEKQRAFEALAALIERIVNPVANIRPFQRRES